MTRKITAVAVALAALGAGTLLVTQNSSTPVKVAPVTSPSAAGDAQPVQAIQDPHAQGEGIWADRPQNLKEMVDAADGGVVKATVDSVEAGPTQNITSNFDANGNPISNGGTVSIPTSLIHFTVDETWRGSPPSTFVVTHIGTEGSDPVSVTGDSTYTVGEQYVLFLHNNGDGTYSPATPEGRLFIVNEKVGRPQLNNGPAEKLANLPVENLKAAVQHIP